ncbi:MAG TPA: hypothetical protein VM531_11390 [Sphingomicrobium sp.]|jgi:hypothetical protein|nr:hypothetical protein [Sphingomicrobium sp.]
MTARDERALLLTDDERQKFARYLEQSAHSANGIADQLQQLKSPLMAQLALRERKFAAAALLIADRLRQTESQTVQP